MANSTLSFVEFCCVPGLVTAVSPRQELVYTRMFVVEYAFLSVVELQPSSELVEVCLGTSIEVNCTTETDDLLWGTSPAAECHVFCNKDDTAFVGFVIPACDFEAILLSTSPPLLSTATLSNINSSHNGTVLTCLNTIIPWERTKWLTSPLLYEVMFITKVC